MHSAIEDPGSSADQTKNGLIRMIHIYVYKGFPTTNQFPTVPTKPMGLPPFDQTGLPGRSSQELHFFNTWNRNAAFPLL